MRSVDPDPYKLLGVPRSASLDQIKKAYKVAALKHHPDRHPEARRDAQKILFQDISAAMEMLADPKKRQIYDMTHPDPAVNRRPAGYAYHNFFSSTSSRPSSNSTWWNPSCVHQTARHATPAAKLPITTISVTLESLFMSTPKLLKVTRRRFTASGVPWDETISVKVPLSPSCHDGDIITIPQAGNQLQFATDNSSPLGFFDLKVKLVVLKHETFTRPPKAEDKDGNLLLEAVLTLQEALMGAKGKSVKGLNGEKIEIGIPGMRIKDGSVNIISGLGMPKLRKAACFPPNPLRGDLIVTFRVPGLREAFETATQTQTQTTADEIFGSSTPTKSKPSRASPAEIPRLFKADPPDVPQRKKQRTEAAEAPSTSTGTNSAGTLPTHAHFVSEEELYTTFTKILEKCKAYDADPMDLPRGGGKVTPTAKRKSFATPSSCPPPSDGDFIEFSPKPSSKGPKSSNPPSQFLDGDDLLTSNLLRAKNPSTPSTTTPIPQSGSTSPRSMDDFLCYLQRVCFQKSPVSSKKKRAFEEVVVIDEDDSSASPERTRPTSSEKRLKLSHPTPRRENEEVASTGCQESARPSTSAKTVKPSYSVPVEDEESVGEGSRGPCLTASSKVKLTHPTSTPANGLANTKQPPITGKRKTLHQVDTGENAKENQPLSTSPMSTVAEHRKHRKFSKSPAPNSTPTKSQPPPNPSPPSVFDVDADELSLPYRPPSTPLATREKNNPPSPASSLNSFYDDRVAEEMKPFSQPIKGEPGRKSWHMTLDGDARMGKNEYSLSPELSAEMGVNRRWENTEGVVGDGSADNPIVID
ncbi:hypothetical protein HDU67_003724 [Dinochytrium kinnereticum]|nr:hypothetical protein HDU67_003724 [Dinochytrium kinnereticum]